jgi:hypothetical protein
MPDRPRDDARSPAGRLYDSYGASLCRYALMLLTDPRPPRTPSSRKTTDPCGFGLVSNQAGLIFNAEPIR